MLAAGAVGHGEHEGGPGDAPLAIAETRGPGVLVVVDERQRFFELGHLTGHIDGPVGGERVRGRAREGWLWSERQLSQS